MLCFPLIQLPNILSSLDSAGQYLPFSLFHILKTLPYLTNLITHLMVSQHPEQGRLSLTCVGVVAGKPGKTLRN